MQSDFRSFFSDSDIVFYQKAIQFKMLLKLDELVVKVYLQKCDALNINQCHVIIRLLLLQDVFTLLRNTNVSSYNRNLFFCNNILSILT